MLKYIYTSLVRRYGFHEFAFLKVIDSDLCYDLIGRRLIPFPDYQYSPIKVSSNLYICRIQMTYRTNEYIAIHLNDEGELHRIDGPAVICSADIIPNVYKVPGLNEYYLNGVCLSEVDQAFVFDNFPDEKLKPAIFNLDHFSKKGE